MINMEQLKSIKFLNSRPQNERTKNAMYNVQQACGCEWIGAWLVDIGISNQIIFQLVTSTVEVIIHIVYIQIAQTDIVDVQWISIECLNHYAALSINIYIAVWSMP